MDRQIRKLGMALLALFLIAFVQINYIQVFAADRIANDPANAQRQLIAEYKVDRGSILAADGTTVLASSRKSPGALRFQRRYPHGELYAHETGFYSFVFGRTELEQSYNDFLTGDAAELLPQTLTDLILGRPKQGATIVTTLVPRDPGGGRGRGRRRVRRRRDRGDRPGDRRRARPGLRTELRPEPARLAGPEGRPRRVGRAERRSREAAAVARERRAVPARLDVQARDGVGRARERVRPGRACGPTRTSSTSRSPTRRSRTSAARRARAASQITLADALRQSCNVVFGEVGLELGPEKLAEQARKYGFTAEAGEDLVPFDIPWTSGVFPAPETFEGRDPAVAISAIGQQDVAANPLQMALVGAAIANGGVEMQPRLVTEARDPSGRVIADVRPAGVLAAALGRERRRPHADDDRRGRGRDRHRGPDPRRDGRGQDGHRPARRGREPARVVRVLRARRRLRRSPSRLSCSTAVALAAKRRAGRSPRRSRERSSRPPWACRTDRR